MAHNRIFSSKNMLNQYLGENFIGVLLKQFLTKKLQVFKEIYTFNIVIYEY